MKQYNGNKQQWLLCAALIMALGSSSYFQVASNKLSSVELASLDGRSPQAVADDLAEQMDVIQYLKDAKKVEQSYLESVKDDKSKSDNFKLYEFYKTIEHKNANEAKTAKDILTKNLKIKQSKNAKTAADSYFTKFQVEKADTSIKEKTEGTASPTLVCEGGCAPTEENIAAAKKILEAAKKIETIKEAKEKTPELVAETVPETAKERRERLAQERLDAKEEKEEAKRIKAEELQTKKQEAKEIRNDKFNEGVEKIAEECKEDIECATSGLTNLLSRFTGDKKVDNFVVNKAFNQVISKDLRNALRSSENTQAAAEALFDLNSEIPSEYRFLKNKTIDLARNEALSRALEVTRNFKMADDLTNAKHPLEAIQYMNAGNAAANAFVADSRIISGSITAGLTTAEDRATMDYVNRIYMPDMQKLMMNLSNPMATDANATTAKPITTAIEKDSLSSDNLSTPATVSSRNSRSGSASTVTSDGKSSSTQQSGVQFGTPSSSPRGDRRSN